MCEAVREAPQLLSLTDCPVTNLGWGWGRGPVLVLDPPCTLGKFSTLILAEDKRTACKQLRKVNLSNGWRWNAIVCRISSSLETASPIIWRSDLVDRVEQSWRNSVRDPILESCLRQSLAESLWSGSRRNLTKIPRSMEHGWPQSWGAAERDGWSH